MRVRKILKLTPEQAAEIRRLAQSGMIVPQRRIARVMGISESHVSNIKHERRWPPGSSHRASVGTK